MANNLTALKDPKVAAQVNHRLELMRLLLPQFTLRDLRLWVSHVHLGPGSYLKGYQVRPHTHPEIQIESLLSGQATFDFGNRQLDLRADQTLFIPPEVRHHWRAKSQSIMMGITLSVSGPARGKFLNECRGLRTGGEIVIEAGKERNLPQIIRNMSEPEEPALGVEQNTGRFLNWMYRALTTAFDLEDWSVNSNGPLTREDRITELISKATQFMQDHLEDPLRSTEIAAHVGMSSRQLNRLFEEFTEDSLSRTLHRIRLNKAMEMLQNHPEYSIEGIALACGFNSHSYFTQRFITAFGVRPSQIQETVGK